MANRNEQKSPRKEMINTAKPLTLGNHSTQEQVECQYKSSSEKHDRERLLAILMAYQNNTQEQISLSIRHDCSTIARWLKTYREGGIKQLLQRKHGGRKASLNDSCQKALVKKLYSGKWKKAKEIQSWLRTRDVELKLSAIYYWLYRLRASWKLPRKSHEKRNPKARECFMKEIVTRLEELSIPDDRDIHVWVEDEHRYGLMSVIRRCWTMKGHRPKAIHNDKYEWGYAYGALDLVTGKSEFLYTPTVSLEWSKEFLRQIVSTDPEAIHIILWDRAGFHPETLEGELSESVRIVPFPAYSPDLNPIEPLWNVVKREISNKLWKTLEDMERCITKALKPYWKDVKQVWSLLGNTWLTRGVIVFLQRRIDRLYPQWQANCQSNIDYG